MLGFWLFMETGALATPWIGHFEVEAAVPPGEAVFVLGTSEELGGDNPTRAVMLAPQGEGKWGGKLRLQTADGIYRYLIRKTGAEEYEDPKNAVLFGEPRVMREVEGGGKLNSRRWKERGSWKPPRFWTHR